MHHHLYIRGQRLMFPGAISPAAHRDSLFDKVKNMWIEALIDKYYGDNAPLRHILMTHSQSVAAKAVDVVRRHPELHADETFVREAAMLHDIGIFKTNAPGIQCFGSAPYIRSDPRSHRTSAAAPSPTGFLARVGGGGNRLLCRQVFLKDAPRTHQNS